MKTVYVIKTSEDGNIGVYTNKKKVHKAVKSYFDNSWSTSVPKNYDNRKLSYSNICKYPHGDTYESEGIEVEIQRFVLNR